MIRYVTFKDNKTIDKESAEQFDGSVPVYVADNVLSTYLNTPWLCWGEENSDGTYLLHVPEDAPRPTYEQKIADFTNELATLKQNDADLSSQLDKAQQDLATANKKNQALIAQVREMQAQAGIVSAQLASLSADDQAKSAALDSANAKIAQSAQPASVAPASQAPAQAQSEAPKSVAPEQAVSSSAQTVESAQAPVSSESTKPVESQAPVQSSAESHVESSASVAPQSSEAPVSSASVEEPKSSVAPSSANNGISYTIK